MATVNSEEDKTVTEMPKSSSKLNNWKIISIILGIVVIILLVLMFGGGVTGGAISESSASEKLVEYLNSMTGGGVELVSSEDTGSLYEVIVSYQGSDIPVYITKDGKYFVQGAVPISGEIIDNSDAETQQPQEVPKSNKPKVEVFVFSYCPYGLQFEKALFPVYDLLKDKADINIVAIGAMHGEFEKIESLRQISIEKLYGKDKLFAYLKEFDTNTNIGSCSGDATCLNKYLPAVYSKLGINKSKVENYMETSAEAVYGEQMAMAAELGQSGSPGFVINGVSSQVARNPEAIKQAICSAFNTAPSECSQTLSTASASPGFGASSSSSSSSTASC